MSILKKNNSDSLRAHPEIVQRAVLFLSAALFGLAINPLAGYYRTTFLKEAGIIKVTLGETSAGIEALPAVYDFSDAGLFKYLMQPGRFSLSGGKGPNIVNGTGAPLRLRLDLEGFVSEVWWDSTDTSFDRKTGEFSKPLASKGSVAAVLHVKAKRALLAGYREVDRGYALVYNADTGNLLQRIPVEFVNTRVKEKI